MQFDERSWIGKIPIDGGKYDFKYKGKGEMVFGTCKQVWIPMSAVDPETMELLACFLLDDTIGAAAMLNKVIEETMTRLNADPQANGETIPKYKMMQTFKAFYAEEEAIKLTNKITRIARFANKELLKLSEIRRDRDTDMLYLEFSQVCVKLLNFVWLVLEMIHVTWIMAH